MLLFYAGITAAAWFLTKCARHYAVARGMLDVPNERSSHMISTPRGGGLAIVVTFLLVLSCLALSGQVATHIFLGLGGGGALVAGIGYCDDRHNLSAKTRLFGHFIAAAWAVVWIGDIPHLDVGFTTWNWGWLGYIVSVLGLVWLLNLYNFMDGIDGIAASEAVFAAGMGGILLITTGTASLGLIALSLASGCLGFLFWNWPPAKIFMGDVGSGFLGYTLGVLAIISDQESAVSLWVWLILLSIFVVDTTITLFRRLIQGKKVYQAHRSHGYQHATAQMGSHLKVTLGVMGINVLIMLPLALITLYYPNTTLLTTGTAVIALSLLAIHFHAGVDKEKCV